MTELSPHKRIHEAIGNVEQKLIGSFEQDVGTELEVADIAASALATVLISIGERTGNIDVDEDGTLTGGDVHVLQLFALQLMGARAFRVMRAARASLACGYEAESRAHDRIIIELNEHRRAILADPSGAEAKAWMEGTRGRGIGERVTRQAPEGMYLNLSMDSHGDPQPLARLLDPEMGAMLLEPKRTPATRASLLMHAGFARDQAVAIATFAGVELNGIDGLDAAIRAASAKLDADAGPSD